LILALVATACVATPATADAPALELESPASLEVDRPAEVLAIVRGIAPDLPMVLRAQSEGSAIEVVRRSLLGAEAESLEDGSRRFRIPVVARAAGAAVVRVSVITYRCESSRCTPFELEATTWLRVERR
jgi:hypothetical protein